MPGAGIGKEGKGDNPSVGVGLCNGFVAFGRVGRGNVLADFSGALGISINSLLRIEIQCPSVKGGS